MQKKESRLSVLLATAKSTFILFIITGFTISALIYLIYQINKVDTLKRTIDKQKQELVNYKLQNDRLKKNIVELERFNRIKEIASKNNELNSAKSAPIRFRVEKDSFNKRLEELKTKLKTTD
jgi:cell division protein FtsL